MIHRTINILERPSDDKPLLIEQKDGIKGKRFSYRQGRVYEVSIQNKPLEIVTTANKYAIPVGSFLSKNNNEQALSEFFTDEGKVFFATAEGKKELEHLIEVISMNLDDKKDIA